MTVVDDRPVTSEAPRTAPPRRPLRSARRATGLLPAAVLMGVFLVVPIGAALWGSLTNEALTGTAAGEVEFVGLDNYAAVFAAEDFPLVVVNTVVFVLVSAVLGQNLVGLGLAVLMRAANRRLSALVGTIVVTAWVLPEIVAAFAAYAFFRDDGTLNAFLGLFGLGGTSWLFAFPLMMVIIANVWRGAAFSMLVYSAALSNVPDELTEAAEVDGADARQRLWYVVVPLLRPTIATNSMLVTLQTLSVFTLIWVMTAGGPSSRSTTLPILAYQEAFQFGQLGYGTAIATLLLVIGAVFSIVYIRALRGEVQR